MTTIFWIIAALVIVGLAGYALHLALRLRSRDRQRAQWRTEVEQMVSERSDKIRNSIQVIAAAMIEEQMSISECVIRLSALLHQLGPVAAEERYQSLHRAAGELEHIPILDDWKKLKFRQQMKHMQEMQVVEDKYGDFVIDICRTIQKNGIDTPAKKEAVGHYQP
ncbi:DUF2489 domain-containing protein [Porticoccus sp. W117]|uniref:DUF2489 domain-containing protein n=1 Tax=Porticoccus sp. W117 TaxID=3054777 RepID=UPI00259319FC|nr:DUF2489 domain-containing protein [Porticoccus sp. W117]MDM3870163.1 DUF2489 domain-containing protein [Porticoccus sp. W117]